MNLTSEQHQQLSHGEPVEVDVDGEKCVLLTRQAYERVTRSAYDVSEWSTEEMDLLAAETADLLAGDGFDQEDDA